MPTTIDPKRYARLLARTLPRVIDSAKEYERLLGEAESLMDAGAGRTLEEDTLLQLMVSLIEAYEQKRYAVPQASQRGA